MIDLTVKISGIEGAKALLSKAAARMKEAQPVIEMAAVDAVQDHLQANYVGKANQLGGPSTGYWARVLNSVEGTHDGRAVTVTMKGAGLLMKWQGGVIKPSGRVSSVTGKPIKFLAIPATAAAHGKVPAMFGKKLYAIRGDRGGVLKLMSSDKRQASDPVMFYLSRSATIKPDKNILPPSALMGRKVGEAVSLFMNPDNPAQVV